MACRPIAHCCQPALYPAGIVQAGRARVVMRSGRNLTTDRSTYSIIRPNTCYLLICFAQQVLGRVVDLGAVLMFWLPAT